MPMPRFSGMGVDAVRIACPCRTPFRATRRSRKAETGEDGVRPIIAVTVRMDVALHVRCSVVSQVFVRSLRTGQRLVVSNTPTP